MPNEQLDIEVVETVLADFKDPETGRYGMDLDQIASNATKRNARNVFDVIIRDGHDEQFVSLECDFENLVGDTTSIAMNVKWPNVGRRMLL